MPVLAGAFVSNSQPQAKQASEFGATGYTNCKFCVAKYLWEVAEGLDF